jgi:hypothetical protein
MQPFSFLFRVAPLNERSCFGMAEHYYFCTMKCRYLSCLVLLLSFTGGFAQIRVGTLRLQRKEVYEIQGTDILVVDTLVMNDSSRLILNSSKKDNFIHAKRIIAGRGAMITGRGEKGTEGKAGTNGTSFGGPCRDGSDGSAGSPGDHGKDAVNLSIYTNELTIRGTLIIDLNGGDGGSGGKGGAGGDGSAGTKLCRGGSGGNGGNGSNGGDGAIAGNLTITTPLGPELRSRLIDKLFVKLFGGFGGQAGEGGSGGQRGLGPKEGIMGKKGLAGAPGKPGKKGAISLERKQ